MDFDRADASQRAASRAVVLIGAAFCAALVLLVPGHPAGIRGEYDVAQLVAYMRSPLIGHDLDFTDDVRPAENALPHTITGRTHNAFPLGGPLLWMPLYAAGHVATLAARAAGAALPADGYSSLYQLGALAAAFLVSAAGLLASWAACRRVAPDGALAAVLICWLGSFLVYYTHLVPIQGHGAGFATSAAFVAAWLWWHESPRPGAAAVMGLAGGLAVLTRWQAAGLLVLVAAEAWRHGRRLQAMLAGAVGAAVVMPQLVMWQILYGAWWRPPRGELAGVFLKWTSPRVWQVLFSSWHGLFAWSPILLFGAAGLIALAVRRPRVGGPLLLAVAIQAYLNGIAMDWWAGGSYGMRRFDVALPALACGLAFAGPRRRTARVLAGATGAIAIALNLATAIAFDRGAIGSLVPVPPLRLARAALDVVPHVLERAAQPSWQKAAWIMFVAVACGLARGRVWRLPSAGAAAGGALCCLLVAAGLWAIRGPARFNPYALEARLFSPARALQRQGPRLLRPGESAAVYLYVLPGFLPAGTYAIGVRTEPYRTRESATSGAYIRVEIEGVEVATSGMPLSAVELRRGFYELRIWNDGGAPAQVRDVLLSEGVRGMKRLRPIPLDPAEHAKRAPAQS